MDIKYFISKMDAIENLITETISLQSLEKELTNKATEQDRANALNVIAWRENLPGLYDPQTGKYIKKQTVQPGRNVNISDYGTVESDRILSARGLLPSGAQLDQGGMFGSDEYQQKARTSLRDVSAMKASELSKKEETQQKVMQLNSLLSKLVQARSAEVKETYIQDIEQELLESFGYQYNEDEQLNEYIVPIIGLVTFAYGIWEPLKDLYYDIPKIMKTSNASTLNKRIGARAEEAVGEVIINLSLGTIFQKGAAGLSKLQLILRKIPILGSITGWVISKLNIILSNKTIANAIGVISTQNEEQMKRHFGKIIVGSAIAWILNRFKNDTDPSITPDQIDEMIGSLAQTWLVSPVQSLEELTNNSTQDSEHNTSTADVSNTGDPEVLAVQKALLQIDPNCLPKYGADGKIGSETMAAIGKYMNELDRMNLSETPTYDIKYFQDRLKLIENSEEVNDYYDEYTFSEEEAGTSPSLIEKGKQWLIKKFPNLAKKLSNTNNAPATPVDNNPDAGSATTPVSGVATKPIATSPTAKQSTPPNVSNTIGLSNETQNIVNQIMHVMHDLSMIPGSESRKALDNAESILRKVPGVNVPSLLQQVYSR